MAGYLVKIRQRMRIRTLVVDDQKFIIGIGGLAEHAFHTGAQDLIGVARGNDDTDQFHFLMILLKQLTPTGYTFEQYLERPAMEAIGHPYRA